LPGEVGDGARPPGVALYVPAAACLQIPGDDSSSPKSSFLRFEAESLRWAMPLAGTERVGSGKACGDCGELGADTCSRFFFGSSGGLRRPELTIPFRFDPIDKSNVELEESNDIVFQDPFCLGRPDSEAVGNGLAG
jgi:hypothetical protein